jgi:hypothetical protein
VAGQSVDTHEVEFLPALDESSKIPGNFTFRWGDLSEVSMLGGLITGDLLPLEHWAKQLFPFVPSLKALDGIAVDEGSASY